MYRAQYVELPFGRIFRDTATLSNADRLAAEDLERRSNIIPGNYSNIVIPSPARLQEQQLVDASKYILILILAYPIQDSS